MSLSVLTGFTTGTTLVASGSSYGSGFTGGNAIQAGDLIIVTLLAGGASTTPFSAAGMNDNLGAGGYNAFVPVTTATASSQYATIKSWTKRAVGGETSWTPTFTQTTHTRNTLVVDVIRGSVGLPTIDPQWVSNTWTTFGSTILVANDSGIGLAMPSGKTAYQSPSLVYGFSGTGAAFGGTPTTTAAGGLAGGTATTLTGATSTFYAVSGYYLSTSAATSTGNVYHSWTTTNVVACFNVTIFEQNIVVPNNPFGAWAAPTTVNANSWTPGPSLLGKNAWPVTTLPVQKTPASAGLVNGNSWTPGPNLLGKNAWPVTTLPKAPLDPWRRHPTVHQWIVNQKVVSASNGTNPAVTFVSTGTNFQPGDILLFVCSNSGATAVPTLVTDGFGNVAAAITSKAGAASSVSLFGFVIPPGAVPGTNIGVTWTINQATCSVIAYDIAGGTASAPMSTFGVPYFDTAALGTVTSGTTDSTGSTSVTTGSFGGEFILHGTGLATAVTATFAVTPSTAGIYPQFRGFTSGVGTPDSASSGAVHVLASYYPFGGAKTAFNPVHTWTTSSAGASFTYALRPQITTQWAEQDTTFSAVAVGTWSIHGSPIPVGYYPQGAVATPDGSKVYISNNGDGTVSVIDTAHNVVIATINVGGGSAGTDYLAITPDGSKVYVPNYSTPNVTVISTATDAIVGSPVTGVTAPKHVVFNSTGTTAYVASQSGIQVINVGTQSATSTIALSYSGHSVNAFQVAIDTTNSTLYVIGVNGVGVGVFQVVDIGSATVTHSVALSNQPRSLAYNSSANVCYVGVPGDLVQVINLSSFAVTTLDYGPGLSSSPNGWLAVDSTNSYLYVTDNGTNRAYQVNLATLAVGSATVAGGNPNQFALLANGLMYATAASANQVDVLVFANPVSQTTSFTSLAAGTATIAATASETASFTSVAVATVSFPGSASQTTNFTGSATGVATIAATAELDTTFTSVAVGAVVFAGTGELDTTFTSSATGAVSIAATASETANFTSIAAGTITIASTGELDTTFTSTATGAVSIAATAELDTTFTSAAAGAVSISATGELDTTFTSVAAGLVTFVATGELDTTFSSSAAASVSISATGELDTSFNGAASASITIGGAGATTVSFAGAASAVVSISATGSLAASFTGSAAGVVSIPATASLSATYVALASASITIPATGELDTTVTTLATAAVSVPATGSTSIGFTSVAAGTVSIPATGSLNVGYTGAASAAVTIAATGELDITFTGSASGSEAVVATGELDTTFTSVAVGAVSISATGELDITFDGSGVGTYSAPSAAVGELDITFTSTASASIEIDTTASLAITFSSLAAGTVQYQTIAGTGELDTAFTASAAGAIEIPGTGSLTTITYVAIAQASVELDVEGSLDVGYSANAQATVEVEGAGALDVAFTSHASGSTRLSGAGAVNASFTGSAAYSVTVPDTGVVNAAFTSLAVGHIEVPATAELQIGFGSLAEKSTYPATCSTDVTFTGVAHGVYVFPPEFPFVEQPLIFGVPAILERTDPGAPRSPSTSFDDQPVASQYDTPGPGQPSQSPNNRQPVATQTLTPGPGRTFTEGFFRQPVATQTFTPGSGQPQQPVAPPQPIATQVAEPGAGQDDKGEFDSQPIATQTQEPGEGPWPPA